MNTWLLKTEHDPLARTSGFLRAVWDHAGLDGMVVPAYQPDGRSVKQSVLHDPVSLREADPFVPLMQVNASSLVIQWARWRPQARMAAVLRPCEFRALRQQAKSTGADLENWMMIGVDCPACFPVQDFEWRVERAGSVEALTRDVLRNMRQGGVALDRFRSACSMCTKPGALQEDICLGLLGLPVKDLILVKANNASVLERLPLGQLCDAAAPQVVVALHDHMLQVVKERRERIRDRQASELTPDLPSDLDQLVTFLENCQPCVRCMEACPVSAQTLVPAVMSHALTREMVREWLASCAECGMCEQICPKQMPLAAIMNRVRRESAIASLAA
jgi:formate dehydrogenase subunit beta